MKKYIRAVSKQLTMATVVVAIVSCSVQNSEDLLSPVSARVPSQIEVPVTNLPIDSQKILDSHNSIRKRLGVPPLRWSTRLESYSSEWATYLTTTGDCIPRKRGLIGLPSHKNGLGENVQRIEPQLYGDGRAEVAAVDENNVVIGWAKQGIDYNYADNKCRVNESCDNYTQVVWRDSQVLGCAASSCSDNSQIWVCNYDPPGNYFGQKPY